MAILRAVDSDQPVKYRTGEKMGEGTIVPELQAAADSLLNAKLTEIDGQQGQVIVMEVQTGEILAMAGRERNYEGKFQPCKNFAYRQELGSLTKTASLLALLDMRRVDTTYVIHTGSGIWAVDDKWIMRDHNWRRGGYQDINISRALEVSSNIGISEPVCKFYKGHEMDFFDDLNKMSFGQPDYIDGIDELKPSSYASPKDSDWVSSYLAWSAIGYLRKIAPIQMLTFYNAIANDGKMVKPTLKTGEVEVINPQIASKANINVMKTILEHVVSQGLGRKAGTEFLLVAGKTGTSQVAEYDFGEENYVSEYQVAFCGYFPADAPKYSMIVSMNKLGLPASGGGMAGVLFHDIVEWMITHGMPNTLMVDEETNDTIKISEDNIQSIKESLANE
jgi:cell division protein FtsI (penicillin-binding protein 3)